MNVFKHYTNKFTFPEYQKGEKVVRPETKCHNALLFEVRLFYEKTRAKVDIFQEKKTRIFRRLPCY